MPGVKRSRSAGGGGFSMVHMGRQNRNSKAMRRIGSRSLSGALARVHTFKRVGDLMQVIPVENNAGLQIINGSGSGAFPYIQTGAFGNPGITGTCAFGAAMTFQLSQCANIGEITNLFDNYRIKKVTLRFDYSANSAPQSGAYAGLPGVSAVPIMHICPDFDDNDIPSGRTRVLENGYVRTVRLDKPFTMTLTPRAQSVVSTGAAGGAVGVGGLLPNGMWLDSSTSNIPHFGVKFWMDDFASNTSVVGSGLKNVSLRITPTYYLEAKNVV